MSIVGDVVHTGYRTSGSVFWPHFMPPELQPAEEQWGIRSAGPGRWSYAAGYPYQYDRKGNKVAKDQTRPYQNITYPNSGQESPRTGRPVTVSESQAAYRRWVAAKQEKCKEIAYEAAAFAVAAGLVEQ